MAIKFSKPAAAKKAPPISSAGPLASFAEKPGLSIIAAEIDAYGAAAASAAVITAEIKALTAKLAPFKAAEKVLLDAIDKLQLDPDIEGRLEKGEKFMVEVGPRRRERVVEDMEAAKKALGAATFMKLVKLNLTDLDKYLSPEELSPIIKVDRGKHVFKAIAR